MVRTVTPTMKLKAHPDELSEAPDSRWNVRIAFPSAQWFRQEQRRPREADRSARPNLEKKAADLPRNSVPLRTGKPRGWSRR